VLIVLSGLPGSGKSTIAVGLARRLGAPLLAVDRIESALLRAGVPMSFETGVAAYEVAGALAAVQVGLGLDVVVDAVNSLEIARDTWRRTDAPRCVIEVACSDADEHRRRLAARVRDLDGFPEPTWAYVEQRRREWEPWTEERLVLDSVDDVDANVDRALDWIATCRTGPGPRA